VHNQRQFLCNIRDTTTNRCSQEITAKSWILEIC
jgi:hypothetical protein